MTIARFLIALCLVGLAAGVASAEEPARDSARQHFERGEKLYALTRFSEALEEYQKAFDAVPLAGLLFNIGQCYRNLGDYDSAVFSYRQYLKLAPSASNRSQVEQLIRELEAQRDQHTAERDTQRLGLARPRPTEPAPGDAGIGRTADRRRAGTVPPAARDSSGSFVRAWWFWSAIAVVGAAGGVAIYELTRTQGPPMTDLGNIVFGK
jgi:tetratricopeptide (TPR) repeat protein